MPNIPKPELEQGAYIAYANKPGIIVDGSGDGDYIAYANEPGTIPSTSRSSKLTRRELNRNSNILNSGY